MMASKENLYNYRFILIIFLLVCFDIFSKVIANNSLLFGQSVDTVFPFIELLLIFNSGIAFGIFDNKGVNQIDLNYVSPCPRAILHGVEDTHDSKSAGRFAIAFD